MRRTADNRMGGLAMTLKRTLCVLPVLLAGSAILLAQTDLTGFWVFRAPTGDGNYRETFFDLKQSGDAITGEVAGGRKMPISEGTLKNGKLHFAVTFSFGQQTRTTTYEGTVAGDKIELTMLRSRGNPVTGVLERSRPEAALPPPRLPLPALHDVPDNGLVRTPPMGWNSWNLFAGRIDDKTVREIADATARVKHFETPGMGIY